MSLFDLGNGLRWGECVAIVRACLQDPRTWLGADAIGLVMPMSLAEFIQITQATHGHTDFLWEKKNRPDAREVESGKEILLQRSAFRYRADFLEKVS